MRATVAALVLLVLVGCESMEARIVRQQNALRLTEVEKQTKVYDARTRDLRTDVDKLRQRLVKIELDLARLAKPGTGAEAARESVSRWRSRAATRTPRATPPVARTTPPVARTTPRAVAEVNLLKRIAAQAQDYKVQWGDTLGGIAYQFDVGTKLLQDLNGLKSPSLRAGKTIRVVKGPFRVVVSKKAYTLTLYLGQAQIKTYRVALGKDNSTPTGTFKVLGKLPARSCPWTNPETGRMVRYDDPEYPLGSHCIKFSGDGYWIHGTNDPGSIGTPASRGCVRLRNRDVEELYGILTRNTPVIIQD